ncbi:MAG: response regulator [Terriglobales bacterium]
MKISALSLPKPVTLPAIHSKYRAIVVDDSPAYVEVVCALLALEDVVDVIGRAGDGAEAIRMVAQFVPDLVIMDVHMAGVSGLTAATLIADCFPASKVILMSADEALLPAALASGASAFIHKPPFAADFARVLASLD